MTTMRERVARAAYAVLDGALDDTWYAVVERRTRMGLEVSSPTMDQAWKIADAMLPLIAAAKAEERESAVQACSAIAAKYTQKKPGLAAIAWRCCDAIRSRVPGGGG